MHSVQTCKDTLFFRNSAFSGCDCPKMVIIMIILSSRFCGKTQTIPSAFQIPGGSSPNQQKKKVAQRNIWATFFFNDLPDSHYRHFVPVISVTFAETGVLPCSSLSGMSILISVV